MTNLFLAQLIIASTLGALIGYTTNWLAIRMLFRPYKKLFFTIPFTSITLTMPFTPGLFPKSQERLANKVAEIVTNHLFTSSDITSLTVELVTPENVQGAVDRVVDSIISEFQNINKLINISEELAVVVTDFLNQALPEIINSSVKNNNILPALLEKAFDTIIVNFRIPEDMAYTLTTSFFTHIATPDGIRRTILSFLTRENIAIINRLVKDNAKGSYFLISRILSVKLLLENLADYMAVNADSTNDIIYETIENLDIKPKTAKFISKLSFKDLPYSNVAALREYGVELTTQYILENRKQMSDKLTTEEMTRIITNRIIRFDLKNLDKRTLDAIKREIAFFITKYLNERTEKLIERMIPELRIDKIIAQKILQFSPQQLERILLEIVRKELAAIEMLGGGIGFFIGALQVVIAYSLYVR